MMQNFTKSACERWACRYAEGGGSHVVIVEHEWALEVSILIMWLYILWPLMALAIEPHEKDARTHYYSVN